MAEVLTCDEKGEVVIYPRCSGNAASKAGWVVCCSCVNNSDAPGRAPLGLVCPRGLIDMMALSLAILALIPPT